MVGLRAFAAELSGTFCLVLGAAGAVCMDALTGGRLGPGCVALAYAAATVAAFHSFPGAIGRFNPALTLADAGFKRIGALQAVFALTAQLLGSACAALFLRAALSGRPDLLEPPYSLGACALQGIGYRSATLVEAVLTFFLACAVAASNDARARRRGPLAIGAATLLGALAAGPLTGAALNPARAFGPAIASGFWTHHYVYWVGPLAGAALAALVSPYLVHEEKRP
ncbi:MAG: aquaporin [Elusimicrobiota bacterium]|nr:aquaporin [Elusimicrobiota bacterium]